LSFCPLTYLSVQVYSGHGNYPQDLAGSHAALRSRNRPAVRSRYQVARWPLLPKCGSVKVGLIASRQRLQCREKGCRKQFSLTTGTIFESTHLRLDQWMVAVWMIVNCRNGVSSCEIARTIGCKQQSAWHLLHRARHILQPEYADDLRGEVEADSDVRSGAFKFMSPARRAKAWERKGVKGKTAVHALLERGSGQVRASVIVDESDNKVRDHVLEHVEAGSALYTDMGRAYLWAEVSPYNHQTVNHRVEYVNGRVHTNSLENFFNCLRRGLKGTYIAASSEHLEAYVNEQIFRFNHRKETDWQRFDRAMHLIVGKRLEYSVLTQGAKR